MKYVFVLLLAAFLLLAGCASPPSGSANNSQISGNASAAPFKPAVKPVVVPLPPLSEENQSSEPNETGNSSLEAPVSTGACTVEFQKDDVSNLFYVMVKATAPGNISVTCPNGDSGKKQNGLFFCSQLDYPAPAVAYIDGAECGRMHFLDANTNKPAAGKSSCQIFAAPSRITVGGTSVISLKAYTPESKANLSYLCGDTEVKSSASGMVDIGKVCKFNTAGTYDVYVKLNGQTCATTTLVVFEKAKDCSVFESNFTLREGAFVYSAKVAARGYSGSDSITFKCDGIPKQIPLSTLQSPADFTTAIECPAKQALLGNVSVKIGSDACGNIVVE